jgi:hypothetical protein
MAHWELVLEAAHDLTDRGETWLRLRDVVEAAQAIAPEAREGPLRNTVRFHCINDPTKEYRRDHIYLKRPLFVTDDPHAAYGRRFRLLTPKEQEWFLANCRSDLECYLYADLERWLAGEAELTEPASDPEDENSELDDASVEPELAYARAAFEHELEQFMFDNWGHCFKGLTLMDKGRQYRTSDPPVGIIDFLATDDSGNFVVIELKRGDAPRKAIGQILGYMGWVKRRLCTSGQSVHGVLVVKDAKPTLRLAAHVVPNLKVQEYQLSFALKMVEEL